MRESLQNSFHWRLVNNLPASAGKVAMVVARAEVGVSTVSSMLVGCCPVSYTHLDVYKRQSCTPSSTFLSAPLTYM